MLLEFIRWMFINMMVATGLVFLAAYSPARKRLPDAMDGGYPWLQVTVGSVMSVFAMMFPWVTAPGQQMDLRMLPAILVGWDFGWKRAIPIGVVMTAARFLYGGGPGAIRSVFFAVLGIAVIQFFNHRPRTLGWLALMGFVQTFIGWALGFLPFLPVPAVLGHTSPFWLMMLGVNVLGLWFLNAATEHVEENHYLARKLAKELQTKQTVLEMIPYGVLFLDAQGRVIDSNQAARTFLHLGGTYPPEWFAHPELARALKERRRIAGCRVAYRKENGEERIVLLSAVPMEEGGVILGVENVTGLIQEERQEARRDRLELLGRLAAMAAHEIKNPLTTIKGFVQLLAPRPEFEKHRSSFDLVQGEVEHINRVVTDFLVLAASPALQPAVHALDDLLEEVLDATALQFPYSDIKVKRSGVAGLTVRTDRQALKQILKNLVTNAYEAMPDGGLLVIKRELVPEGVQVMVTDTGPGFSADMLPMIFTPYMTTKATGTGLGLAISHKLATDMGARLEISSREGTGCSFQLLLPHAGGMAEVAAAAMPE